MDRLPFEVILQIFEYLPLSDYKALYAVFPQQVIDEALIYKLKNTKKTPMIHLVSTNLHELSSNNINKKNESFIPLYYTSFDPINRTIWSLPDFSSYQHYFRVKDAYVSHGKLVIRNPTDTAVSIPLTSLWDIRKVFPPSRAGSFSGASEYSKITCQELTIYQSSCVLDSCLMPTIMNDGISIVKSDIKDIKDSYKRPNLPLNYQREIPKNNTTTTTTAFSSLLLMPSFSDLTCGYFLVERLATNISTFLDLYCK